MEYVSVRGVDVPALGLGTYRLTGDACRESVETALDVGYRHVDTAEYYDNHEAVGDAIRASDVDREDVFLTTKVWRTNLHYDDVLASAERALDELGLSYVDLLLVHWPDQTVPFRETLGAMNDLQQDGVVEHVGVSNFSVDQLDDVRTVSRSPILTDQVKYNPNHRQDDLLAYCLEHDVTLTAYTPLARGGVLDDPALVDIGERHGKTPAQVTLRWLLQQDCVAAIPKASSETHLRENFDVFDFELTDEEMTAVFEAGGGDIDRIRGLLGL